MIDFCNVGPSCTNASMAWQAVAQHVFRRGKVCGSRDGMTREAIGLSFTLTNPRNNWAFTRQKLSPRYAAAELAWYLSGSGRVEPIMFYAPQYARFADENGIVRGAYGERLAKYNQLHHVIEELKRNRDSRRAVLSMFMPQDVVVLPSGGADLPCTLNLQLLVRDGALDMIARMRSNDIWLGLPYDMFCFTTLQCLIADVLGVEVGNYHHEVGSMHIYSRDYEKIESSLDCTQLSNDLQSACIPEHSFATMEALAKMTTDLEWHYRSREGRDDAVHFIRQRSLETGDPFIKLFVAMLTN